MEREVLLEVKNLDVTFGERKKKYKAVKGVNFKIYKGKIMYRDCGHKT